MLHLYFKHCSNTFLFLYLYSFIYFMWCWGSNLLSHKYKASIPPLSYSSSPKDFYFFLNTSLTKFHIYSRKKMYLISRWNISFWHYSKSFPILVWCICRTYFWISVPHSYSLGNVKCFATQKQAFTLSVSLMLSSSLLILYILFLFLGV